MTRLFSLLLITILCASCSKASNRPQAEGPQVEGKWLTDYTEAQNLAKASHKLLLIYFTGSDWCPPCVHLKNDVLSKPEFADYAGTNYVLLELDFPRFHPQDEEVRQRNEEVAMKFGIYAFPTILVLNGDGKTVARIEGYPRGGVTAFIAELEKLRKS